MGEPTRIRAGMQGERVLVRVLMTHEMESGQRKDGAGKVIPAHFIREVTVRHNGRTVLSAQWGPAVSKNPFLQFVFTGGKPGDTVQVAWVDTSGDTRRDETTIA